MNKIISKKLPDIIGDVMDILKQIKMGDNDLTILKFKVNENQKDVFLNIRLANDHAKIMHEKYNLDYIGESIFKFHKDGYLVLPEMYRHTWNLKNGFPQQSKLANIKLI
jgi:predicted transcriptional regulator